MKALEDSKRGGFACSKRFYTAEELVENRYQVAVVALPVTKFHPTFSSFLDTQFPAISLSKSIWTFYILQNSKRCTGADRVFKRGRKFCLGSLQAF